MTEHGEFYFSSAIRGFHYYRTSWTRVIEQHLQNERETHNPEDHHAVAVVEGGDDSSKSVIGHIPRELSTINAKLSCCFSICTLFAHSTTFSLNAASKLRFFTTF